MKQKTFLNQYNFRFLLFMLFLILEKKAMFFILLPNVVFYKNKDFSLQKAKELYNLLLISPGSNNNIVMA